MATHGNPIQPTNSIAITIDAGGLIVLPAWLIWTARLTHAGSAGSP